MRHRVRSSAFENLVGQGHTPGTSAELIRQNIAQMTSGTRAGNGEAQAKLCAMFARVGFVTPEAIEFVYDAFATTWLDLAADPTKDLQNDATKNTHTDAHAMAKLLTTPESLPDEFWAAFWSIVEDTPRPLSPAEITSRVAALGGLLPLNFHQRAEAATEQHRGVEAPAARAVPALLELATLAEQPEGSLGHAFYRLIVDNQFDLEVLDRETAGLQHLPPALRYVNTRILQMHDIWHLVAGYTTSALHENAISAFQLAQFGHNYSAMYLATVTTASRLLLPAGLPILLQVIAEGWVHGRTSPAYMDIRWEEEWQRPISVIRQHYGITPYQSKHPAYLVEKVSAVLNHPILRAARWLDGLFGHRLSGVLTRGALKAKA